MATHRISRRFLFLASALSLLSGGLLHAAAKVNIDKIGKPIDRVVFKDGAGKSTGLRELTDKKAIVVVFMSMECPVSNSYAQALILLSEEYAKRGVAFFGVCVNQEEDHAQLAKQVQELRIPFPVFKDAGLSIADSFKATVTPEAFVLDANHILRYRGRIDNGYADRLKRNRQITRHDLRRALDEVLAGKPVSEPATAPIGCAIQHADAAPATTGAVTYYRDVLPILQANCQSCHRKGEVGPFSLMTYRQAVNWAGDIKDYTQSRKMPPWKPAEGPAFHNERKLNDKDLATLAAWVDGGTPAGDPKEAPSPRQFIDGWQSGQPDLALTMSDEFQVGPSGPDNFRCFVLPTNLSEDAYVSTVEVRPGNPRIVHHALLFIDTEGQARKLEKKERDRVKKESEMDLGPGYSMAMGVGFVPRGVLGGWAPGQTALRLPKGTGYFLPKGADVVLQLHYHRDGRMEKDRTSIGLYFSKEPTNKRFHGLVIPGRLAVIPAGESHHKVTGSIWVRADCDVHSVMPHMHMLGREIKVTMVPPDGPPRTLVAIKDWDYNWQETYFFKESIKVKADTRFDIEAYYDNSDKNPNNPNIPPKRVTFGEQTTNEMCFGFLGATWNKQGRIPFDGRRRDEKRAEAK